MSRRRLFPCLAAVLACCGGPALAGPPSRDAPPAVPEAELRLRPRAVTEVSLASREGRPYRILISAPLGPEPPGGFPVIYVLDGNAWFGAAVEVSRLWEFEKLPPPVVVGVAYPGDGFLNPPRRVWDFTQTGAFNAVMAAQGLKLGGADELLGFLDSVLKPWVAANYRIDAARQTLYGHSLGGLFVLHVMFASPESFSTYLAASPSIWLSDKLILKEAPRFEADPARTKVRVLLTAGEFESDLGPEAEADYRRFLAAHDELRGGKSVEDALADLKADARRADMVGNARAMASELAAHGVDAHFVELIGDDHLSAAVTGLNRGLPFALRPLAKSSFRP